MGIDEYEQDALWWPRVHAAMRANLGGKTKWSKSGEVVIFSEPTCGRHDLSSWRERAQAQLDEAGIQL